MTSSRKTAVALVVALLALVACSFLLFLQRQAMRAQQAQAAEARAQAAEAARLQADNERLRALESENRRLREESRELPRLRGDIARLRRELAALTNAPNSVSIAPSGPDAATGAAASNAVVFVGQARASLARGQTLVMGGWPVEEGKRTLALFTPDFGTTNTPGDTLVIGGLFLQAPEALLSGPGWEQFQTATREASGSGIFEADQARSFIDALRKMEGVEILSSPRLATTSGTAGSISIGDTDGSGLNVTLLPVLSPDGRTVDLTVSNSLRRLPAPPGR